MATPSSRAVTAVRLYTIPCRPDGDRQPSVTDSIAPHIAAPIPPLVTHPACLRPQDVRQRPQRNGNRSAVMLRLIPTATHRAEPQPAASPVAVLIYLSPAASVRTNQHFKALLSSAAGKPDSPSAHTPPPIRPRLLTEPAEPGSAPGPQKECLRRQLGERGGRCRLMLFPPPWFSPLVTPLSEAPPFKRKSARGENPSRLRRR